MRTIKQVGLVALLIVFTLLPVFGPQPIPASAANCDTPSFNLAPTIPVGTSPQWVAVGDFNGDSKSDLAVANNGSNNVSILLGSGTGNFSLATNFPAGMNPRAVVTADFNSDGKTD